LFQGCSHQLQEGKSHAEESASQGTGHL
jgi:hypothetical protein